MTTTDPSAWTDYEKQQFLAKQQRILADIKAGATRYGYELTYEAAMAELAYLRERMRLLDIPQMQWADERARHQLALQAVSDYASQTGWYFNPTYIERKYGSTSPAEWEPFPSDVEGMKALGARPTMQAIEYAANPRNFVGALMVGGMGAEEARAYTASLVENMSRFPTAQGTRGWQMPITDVLRATGTKSPVIGLLESLVSAGGKDVDQFWAEAASRRPLGQPVTGATFR